MGKMLLALDLATTTGFAWGMLGDIPKASTISFAGKVDTQVDEDIWLRAVTWFQPLLATLLPDYVAIEAPVNTSSPHGGGNALTTLRLIGLQSNLRTIVASARPRLANLVSVQSVRSYFIGNGNIPGDKAKWLVKKRCVELGWLDGTERGFDISDALAVWAYEASLHGDDRGRHAKITKASVMQPKPLPLLQPEPDVVF